MNGHDAYEILIDRRLHGAIEPDEAHRLERHFVSCDTCRGHEAAVVQTEDAMNTTIDELNDRIDWDEVTSRVQDLRSHYRGMLRRMTRLFVLFLALFVIGLFVIGPLMQAESATAGEVATLIVWAGLLAIACSPVGPWRARRRLDEIADASLNRHASLDLLREELDGRIRGIRRGRLVYTALAALGAAVLTAVVWGEGVRALIGVHLFPGIVFWLPALYYWLHERVRALVAERAKLD